MLFVGILDCGGELVADTFIMAMLIRFWLALELHSEKVSRQELVNSCRLGSQQTCSLNANLIYILAQSISRIDQCGLQWSCCIIKRSNLLLFVIFLLLSSKCKTFWSQDYQAVSNDHSKATINPIKSETYSVQSRVHMQNATL